MHRHTPARWKSLAPCLGLAAWMALSASPGQAQSLTLNAEALPAPVLSSAEIERLSTLMGALPVGPIAGLSPDGRTQLVQAGPHIGFMNLETGALVAVHGDHHPVLQHRDIPGHWRVWISPEQLAIIVPPGLLDQPSWQLGIAERSTGRFTLTDVALPAGSEVLALSPGGRWAVTLGLNASASPSQAGSARLPRVRARMHFGLPSQGREPRMLEATSASTRLELIDLHTGQARLITELPAGATTPGVFFDPQGRRFALQSHWFENAPRTEESLNSILVQEALGQFALADNPLRQHSRLAVYDTQAADLDRRELRAVDYPDLTMRFNLQPLLAWSPSGERLLAGVEIPAQLVGRANPSFYKPQAVHFLAFEPARSGPLRPSQLLRQEPLSAPGDDGLSITWLSDSQAIFNPLVGMDRPLLQYDFNSARLSSLAGIPTGSNYGLRPVRDRRELVFVHQSASTPPELWRAQLDAGQAQALTAVNQAARDMASVRAQPVQFILPSGQQRQAYWFAPANAAWPPVQQRVVLWQAGGPGGEMSNSWSTAPEGPLTLLPTLGIGVLMVPLQQRPGLNSAMWNQLADGNHFGSVDIDELAQIAGQVVERGWSRADQIGISGCSYGGYFSAQSIVRHPQRYAAANPQCSLLDLVTEFQTGYTSHIAYLEGGSPWARWDEYRADSPGFHGREVRTPTLIFHGTKDFLPVGIAENFYTDIQASGTPARLLRFVGEPHGLRDPRNQLYAVQEQVSWFRRYLKP